MKKVLQIIPTLDLGGTEAFVMNHYRMLDRRRIQFDFLVFSERNWPYLEEIHQLGGRVFFAPRPTLLHTLRFYKHFRNILKLGGPYEAIHCHGDAGNAVPLLCGMLCKISSRISHAHCIAQPPQHWHRRLAFQFRQELIRRTATKFLACSNPAGEALYGAQFFWQRGAVIKNGIRVESFVQPELHKVEGLKKAFGIPEGTPLVMGNISRFDANKNQLFALAVFRHILRKIPNALLLLGGIDGGCLAKVQEAVVHYGLENQVLFLGQRTDVAECLHLMDVYLFPSRKEGFGMALLEAQAAGCLCFASTGVPAASDMGLGNVSYLSLSLGAAYWAEAVCRGLENRTIPTPDEIRNAFAEKGFDVRKSIEELAACYE